MPGNLRGFLPNVGLEFLLLFKVQCCQFCYRIITFGYPTNINLFLHESKILGLLTKNKREYNLIYDCSNAKSSLVLNNLMMRA